jgi:hypothetical protein
MEVLVNDETMMVEPIIKEEVLIEEIVESKEHLQDIVK